MDRVKGRRLSRDQKEEQSAREPQRTATKNTESESEGERQASVNDQPGKRTMGDKRRRH